ncbi:MAG: hypothetical protein WBQ73_02985 [Candidatus Babeliales bacterium]
MLLTIMNAAEKKLKTIYKTVYKFTEPFNWGSTGEAVAYLDLTTNQVSYSQNMSSDLDLPKTAAEFIDLQLKDYLQQANDAPKKIVDICTRYQRFVVQITNAQKTYLSFFNFFLNVVSGRYLAEFLRSLFDENTTYNEKTNNLLSQDNTTLNSIMIGKYPYYDELLGKLLDHCTSRKVQSDLARRLEYDEKAYDKEYANFMKRINMAIDNLPYQTGRRNCRANFNYTFSKKIPFKSLKQPFSLSLTSLHQ